MDSESDRGSNLQMHFIGGLQKGPVNWTQPLVRLDLSLEGAQLGARFPILRRLMPAWKVSLADIAEVQAVKGMFGSSGLQFRPVHSEKIVFWTSNLDRVADELERLGVIVNRTRIRIRDS